VKEGSILFSAEGVLVKEIFLFFSFSPPSKNSAEVEETAAASAAYVQVKEGSILFSAEGVLVGFSPPPPPPLLSNSAQVEEAAAAPASVLQCVAV